MSAIRSAISRTSILARPENALAETLLSILEVCSAQESGFQLEYQLISMARSPLGTGLGTTTGIKNVRVTFGSDTR
jgi:hypothetical protein